MHNIRNFIAYSSSHRIWSLKRMWKRKPSKSPNLQICWLHQNIAFTNKKALFRQGIHATYDAYNTYKFKNNVNIFMISTLTKKIL